MVLGSKTSKYLLKVKNIDEIKFTIQKNTTHKLFIILHFLLFDVIHRKSQCISSNKACSLSIRFGLTPTLVMPNHKNYEINPTKDSFVYRNYRNFSF